jgi:hypothetical protein
MIKQYNAVINGCSTEWARVISRRSHDNFKQAGGANNRATTVQ